MPKPTANPDLSPFTERGGGAIQLTTFLGLIALGAGTRLLPHPENLTAMGAVALFGGVYFRRWPVAILVPLAALFVSDFVLSVIWYGGSQWSFPATQYVLFGLTVFFGVAVRSRPTTMRMVGTTIAATVCYYLLSNLSEWYIAENGVVLYPKTAQGLLQCYIAALPFVRNMLIGNLVYMSLLFGGWRVAQQVLGRRELVPAKIAA